MEKIKSLLRENEEIIWSGRALRNTIKERHDWIKILFIALLLNCIIFLVMSQYTLFEHETSGNDFMSLLNFRMFFSLFLVMSFSLFFFILFIIFTRKIKNVECSEFKKFNYQNT
ncbi:MAG: hypothetical protein ACTSYF_06960 [Promethearchaeota archaeon]